MTAVPHAGAPGQGLQPLCVLPEHAGKPGETVSALGSAKPPPCHPAVHSSVLYPLVLPQNPWPENHARELLSRSRAAPSVRAEEPVSLDWRLCKIS